MPFKKGKDIILHQGGVSGRDFTQAQALLTKNILGLKGLIREK
jgi:hypothetical protein